MRMELQGPMLHLLLANPSSEVSHQRVSFSCIEARFHAPRRQHATCSADELQIIRANSRHTAGTIALGFAKVASIADINSAWYS